MKPLGTPDNPPGPSTTPDYSFAGNLLQFLIVPTFVLGTDGRVLIWNKACERLTGLPAADIIGTRDHWRAFYDAPRPCLADLVLQGRTAELCDFYAAKDVAIDSSFGVHAENWCVMPRLGNQLYLAIDAGPVFDAQGQLLAVVETVRDMSAQRKAQTKLELLASRDGLTGIINRRGFDEHLREEWARSQRDQKSLALLMIDVDHFKSYNDNHGHQAGDQCLQTVAGALAQALLRPTDLLARYGGEEFAVILSPSETKGASIVAERVRLCVERLGLPHVGSPIGGVVTVSIGLAALAPEPHLGPEELIARADQALYQAKAQGRNRFCVWSDAASPSA